MKRKNIARNALFTSIISLMLCVSMLVGTTFAWFTDSVVSGNNIIAAGNLDVELYHSNKAVQNEKVNGETELFSDIKLWEPGVVVYENFVVANEGNLALKYQLSINITDETVVNGHGLSEALKVAVVEGGFSGDRAAAHALWNTQSDKVTFYDLASFVLPGELEGAEKSNTYGIVIYWEPTDNDNLFNLKDVEKNEDGSAKNPLSITMGVNLFATQEMYEDDSFGNDYDANAELCKFIVSSEEELVEALAAAKNGDVIGIKGNVTWTTGAGIGSTPFIADGVKNITLIGVEAGATFTAIGSGVGAIGIDAGTVTFKDLKIVDESVSYAENSWEHGYLEFRGNTVFENCDVVNAIMMEGDSATFKNCRFNSHADNQYAVWVSNGNASFENCTFTGSRGIKIHEAYGSKVGTVVINKNEFVDLSKKPGLAIGDVDADTTVVLTNNKFIGTQAGDQGLYSYETDTNVNTFNFTDKDNTVAGYADTNSELEEQLQNNATVVLPKGEYTLPSMSGKEGITIIGAADGSTVIGGENASTGFGSNFGKDTTIQNVTFSGSSNGVRSSYAQGGTSVFENCTFAGDSTYGFHIDESHGATFIFNNCTFSGFNAFAGDLVKVVFNNCTFLHNGNYGHTNIWSVAEFNNCTWGEGATYGTRGDSAVIYVNGNRFVDDEAALDKAIAAGDTKIMLAPGEYSLRFTNNTAFNVDNLNIKGMDNAKLTVSSSEAWYGRVQGDNVTFENIHFTSSVGATGKATYNNCTFDNWTICASSGNKETYFNNCDIKGTLNTSTDFSSGNTYVTDSTVAKAEFSGAATMYFTNCQIGELISWDMKTVLENCTVTTLDDSHMKNNSIVVK